MSSTNAVYPCMNKTCSCTGTASAVLKTLLKAKINAAPAKNSGPSKTKKCTKCGKRKPVTSFHKQASTRDGLRYECKKCNSERALKAYHANPQHYIDVQKAWQARNPDKVKQYRNSRKVVEDNT